VAGSDGQGESRVHLHFVDLRVGEHGLFVSEVYIQEYPEKE
jgi:hypothetical protein